MKFNHWREEDRQGKVIIIVALMVKELFRFCRGLSIEERERELDEEEVWGDKLFYIHLLIIDHLLCCWKMDLKRRTTSQ